MVAEEEKEPSPNTSIWRNNVISQTYSGSRAQTHTEERKREGQWQCAGMHSLQLGFLGGREEGSTHWGCRTLATWQKPLISGFLVFSHMSDLVCTEPDPQSCVQQTDVILGSKCKDRWDKGISHEIKMQDRFAVASQVICLHLCFQLHGKHAQHFQECDRAHLICLC